MKNKKTIKCENCIHGYPYDDKFFICITYGGFHSPNWSCKKAEGWKEWFSNE